MDVVKSKPSSANNHYTNKATAPSALSIFQSSPGIRTLRCTRAQPSTGHFHSWVARGFRALPLPLARGEDLAGGTCAPLRCEKRDETCETAEETAERPAVIAAMRLERRRERIEFPSGPVGRLPASGCCGGVACSTQAGMRCDKSTALPFPLRDRLACHGVWWLWGGVSNAGGGRMMCSTHLPSSICPHRNAQTFRLCLSSSSRDSERTKGSEQHAQARTGASYASFLSVSNA